MSKIYYVGEEVGGVEKADLSQVIEFIEKHDVLGLDTETTGLDCHTDKILTIQIGTPDLAYVIEFTKEVKKALKPYLEAPQRLWIGQNLRFDYKMLKAVEIVLSNVFDTMVMEYLIKGGEAKAGYTLDVIVGRYAGIILDKTVQKEFIGMRLPLNKRQIIYAGEDVLHLHKVREEQMKRIQALQLETLAYIENQSVLTLGDIEYNGIKLDEGRQREIIRLTQIKLDTCIKELDNYVLNEPRLKSFRLNVKQGNLFAYEERGVSINYDSSIQIVKALNLIGFDLESSNANQILKYYNTSPFVKSLVDYRESAKIISTYGEKLISKINPKTARVHPNFVCMVTTGRLACSNPNMQNIPKEDLHRSAWVASYGNKIVGGDFGGLELRLIAEASKDPIFLKTFNEGGDLHSVAATMIFKIPLYKVKETPEFLRGKSYRDVAKVINYALAYGATEYKIAATLQIPVEEAKIIIIDYFIAFPKIRKCLENMGRLAIKRGYIRSFNPTRRIRWFKDYNDPSITFERRGEIGREAQNAPFQMGNADMTKLAMSMIRSQIMINNYPVMMINSIHDEILTETTLNFAPTWKPIMEKLMCDAGRVFIKRVPVTVDCVIGDTWMKEKEK